MLSREQRVELAGVVTIDVTLALGISSNNCIVSQDLFHFLKLARSLITALACAGDAPAMSKLVL